jgi:hypothetical protein
MPLNANALIDLDYAELYLDRSGVQGSPEDEALDDEFVESLINGFSTAITNYCRRQFKPTQDAATKDFVFTNGSYLSFAPFEARTVTSVTTIYPGVTPTSTALTLDDYQLEPRQLTPDGTYLSLTLPYYTWVGRAPTIRVVGNWGMAAVPEPVKIACASSVRRAYDAAGARPTAAAEEFGGVVARARFDITLDALGLLEDYRRRELV